MFFILTGFHVQLCVYKSMEKSQFPLEALIFGIRPPSPLSDFIFSPTMLGNRRASFAFTYIE